MTHKVVKTEAEWETMLTPEQYRVCRCSETEPAFTGAYWDCHEQGVYHCACCGSPLFSSEAKFDSGSGWPSFYQPVSEEAITRHRDLSHQMLRTEIRCAACHAHLGHVFPDGPVPTGLRYCLNSIALDLKSR